MTAPAPEQASLKSDAIGFVDALVIGLAATSPAYSLAAAIGPITAAREYAGEVAASPITSASTNPIASDFSEACSGAGAVIPCSYIMRRRVDRARLRGLAKLGCRNSG